MLEESTAYCFVMEEIEWIWFLQDVSKFLRDSTVHAGRDARAGQVLNEILETSPSMFGVGRGVNISTLQNVNYLEPLSSGWPWPKNGPKHLRKKEGSTVLQLRKQYSSVDIIGLPVCLVC
jgi:hypothetical protein